MKEIIAFIKKRRGQLKGLASDLLLLTGLICWIRAGFLIGESFGWTVAGGSFFIVAWLLAKEKRGGEDGAFRPRRKQ